MKLLIVERAGEGGGSGRALGVYPYLTLLHLCIARQNK
ncbi:predicted protein [Botrytis cinerea T4]|uniref:Uncharacterized protein n=1 Tax=Botryotinia fuckeliana (strain T4) TaxID=999810 RepID=G2Y5A3_BOTF4|nr:predicted protein [Botrytis cinerea T4]